MCHKIRCDGESWKLFDFQGELNKAWYSLYGECTYTVHNIKYRGRDSWNPR